MLKVEKISCQKGYNQLFEDLSFYLKDGEIARVMGDNGSGKTSLLKILAGINYSDSGVISLNDASIKTDDYKENTLYLGHNSLLSPQLTVLENLDFLTKLTPIKGDKLQALDKIGLKNYADELCYKLSAGQKRKVILATVFLSTAKLWLLDEPFTALDKSSVEIIENAIKTHAKNGGICVLTTHQKSSLEFIEVNL
jgi:heme exporter protein A